MINLNTFVYSLGVILTKLCDSSEYAESVTIKYIIFIEQKISQGL